jgi:hypothetical protein
MGAASGCGWYAWFHARPHAHSQPASASSRACSLRLPGCGRPATAG